MPYIKPFQGIFYNLNRVTIGDVVAPPYDVISPSLQSELYERSPFNVVRVILGREPDPYGSAANFLGAWIAEKTLVTDSSAGIYVLAQEFAVPDGRDVERWGCIAACKLEEFGKGSVYPHEKTHSGPKEDRFKLFQATNLMFSQIFGLYSDQKHVLDPLILAVKTTTPMLDVKFEGVRNRLWPLRDENATLTVMEFMREQRILIADGHHRYETALQFRDACARRNPEHNGTERYNFVPMFFTNMYDPGLVILPTHRVLHGLPNFDPLKFLVKVREKFDIGSPLRTDQLLRQLARQQHHSFGLILSGHADGYLLTLKDPASIRQAHGVPEVVSQLDVSILHKIIFEEMLGMTDDQQEKKIHLKYEKESHRAIEEVQKREAQAAFLMNATGIEQVHAVASSGTVMPQKSTYFYPKLLSGIVGYAFGDLAHIT